MKVIDLLNKIANGEEVPREIKVDDEYYCYDETENNEFYKYRTITGDVFLTDYANLNDEVEIIEENNKIEKIKSLNNVGKCQNEIDFKDKQHLNNCILKDKINEIIDYINAGVDKE